MHNASGKTDLKNVIILGSRGYSGLELARICLKNPQINLVAAFATDADWKLGDYLPEARALEKKGKTIPVIAQKNIEQILGSSIDVAFLATPAEVSLEWAPKLLAKGIHVIDLSGAFRLKNGSTRDAKLARYKKWYGHDHTALEALEAAVYGLSPWAEITPLTKLSKPALISNPGCYATSILMATLPLLKDGLIEAESLVIDAKSGTSGAGRKAAENLLFTEVDGECLPYKVGKHQHTPEIVDAVQNFSGAMINPFFATHLLATRRGIISSIYAKPSQKLSGLSKAEASQLLEKTFAKYYGDYPLATWGEASPQMMSLKSVVGSARVQISYTFENNQLYIFSVLDNLLKGAASQAFENFNKLMGFKPETNLDLLEGVL